MASRLELQAKLEELLGVKHVYYQPPESVKLAYPAIKYSKDDIQVRYSGDEKYSNIKRYQLISISQRPDSPVIDKILDLPYCSFDRHYVSNNLYHDVFTLYF